MSNARLFCIGAVIASFLAALLTIAFGEPPNPWAPEVMMLYFGVGAVAFFGDRDAKATGDA